MVVMFFRVKTIVPVIGILLFGLTLQSWERLSFMGPRGQGMSLTLQLGTGGYSCSSTENN